MAGIKVTAADRWFSLAIREAANWTCASSGMVDPEAQAKGSSKRLECCHFFGRRNKGTRWHVDNVVCLSHSEHRRFTENPADFTLWYQDYLGAGRYEMLLAKARDIRIKYSTQEQAKDIPKHYRDEDRRLRKERKQGETGILEIISYE